MDFIKTLMIENIDLVFQIITVLLIPIGAKIYCAITKTPDENAEKWKLIAYSFMEKLALIVGRTKETGKIQ